AKSGRSTVLMNVARSCLAQGVRLVVAAPRQSTRSVLGCARCEARYRPGATLPLWWFAAWGQ
ncbi:hypothetical protein, partial [Streptomyces spectabilis]|uniref:hypothetical protein n=1 Tax=Streptomyces spectabilis TaxID=68270 RepID=UPI0033C3A26F